jgi:hypothetical protein
MLPPTIRLTDMVRNGSLRDENRRLRTLVLEMSEDHKRPAKSWAFHTHTS